MKSRTLLFPLMVVAVFVSGCIFDSDSDKKSDTTKKGSVSGTVKLTVTGGPVAGMKVYLINMKAPVDSSNYSNNHGAFIDSTATDSNGGYTFKSISPGYYGIAPANEDTTKVYKFTQSAGSDSCTFAMNGNAFTVNFIAEQLASPGIDPNQFHFQIFLTDSGNNILTGVSYARKIWVLCFPGLAVSTDAGLHSSFTIDDNWGYTAVIYTITNYYEVTVKYCTRNSSATLTRKFTIGSDSDQYPGWTYDYATGTLSRLSE
jgi:hypothetical protein